MDRRDQERIKKVSTGVMTALVILAVIEVGLRISGFERRSGVEYMRFTFPMDEYNRTAPEPFLVRDPVLFWKPKPRTLGHNSKGVFGPEFETTPRPGVFRIVSLGDSCTHFGPGPYPERLARLLSDLKPNRFEVINAGVIGYTSYQGLQRLNTDVAEWSPDLITVYFGWNDHWIARGYRDSQQARRRFGMAAVYRAMEPLRIFQAVRTVVERRLRLVPESGQFRVTPDEFAANLRDIHSRGKSLGAQVWFLTAPHALDLGIPPYLLSSGEISDPSRLLELHQSYTDVVRQVAKETGAGLVDLQERMDRMDKRDLFMDDHIHLSDRGRTLVAQMLAEQFKNF